MVAIFAVPPEETNCSPPWLTVVAPFTVVLVAVPDTIWPAPGPTEVLVAEPASIWLAPKPSFVPLATPPE